MNVQDDSLPGERFLQSNGGRPLFGAPDAEVWELGPRQSLSDWLRLLLSVAFLATAVVLVGRRCLHYVVHHVWNQSRDSPAALIIPVLAVQFLWIMVHVRTGLIARAKIGLGAVAMCMAVFAPRIGSVAAAGQRVFDLPQLCALVLATGIFVDGLRDRGRNLDHATS